MTFYHTRPIETSDVPFLWQSLYQCIYVPEGKNQHPKEILNNPDTKVRI